LLAAGKASSEKKGTHLRSRALFVCRNKINQSIKQIFEADLSSSNILIVYLSTFFQRPVQFVNTRRWIIGYSNAEIFGTK